MTPERCLQWIEELKADLLRAIAREFRRLPRPQRDGGALPMAEEDLLHELVVELIDSIRPRTLRPGHSIRTIPRTGATCAPGSWRDSDTTHSTHAVTSSGSRREACCVTMRLNGAPGVNRTPGPGFRKPTRRSFEHRSLSRRVSSHLTSLRQRR